MANTPPEISRNPFLDAIESLWNDGHSLIPTGKESGKVRLTKLTKKRLPLTTVLKRLESSGSKTYGITLKNIAVVDIDQKSEELIQMMLDRFGNTPFKVSTPEGLTFTMPVKKSHLLTYDQKDIMLILKLVKMSM